MRRILLSRRTPEVCIAFVIIACVAVVVHIFISTMF
jgi:hypothetical protein